MAAAALCAGLAASPALAQEADAKATFDTAMQAAVDGPQDIALASQGTLHLPAGKRFIPQPQAAQMLRAMGNPGDYSDLQGLVFPQEKSGWFAVLRFEKAGYIKDDDAKDWNADELLKSYREGTEEGNKEREKMGVAPIEIVGWAEKPAYDAANRRLVWAMSLRDKGSTNEAEQSVNYNTYALGREGYFSLDLVTGLKELPAQKGEAQTLLGALAFDKGKQYGDFNASTDHVAEYGLAALVLGVGAKKLGLLALGFAFIAKFAKLAILAVVGFGAAITKIFKRNKPAE